MKTAVIAYIPALHEGYLAFLKRHPGELYIIGPALLSLMPRLERDIRAVRPDTIAKAIAALALMDAVSVVTGEDEIRSIARNADVVMPDEDISHVIAERYFSDATVTFDTTFLRWDRRITEREFEVSPDRVISINEAHRALIKETLYEGVKSGDWWRQIGALAVKDGSILLRAHNHHLPSDRSMYILGDPRSNFDAGERPDLYTSIHAEASVIANAARDGIPLLGAALFVSTFPCANCARLMVTAGIGEVYYHAGYSMMDAEKILKDFGVRITMVKLD